MITEILSNAALAVIHALGYAGVFLLSLVESCGIPVPSEIVLPFTGFLVASAQFTLWAAVVTATLGNYVGSIVLYWIGKSGGRWLLERHGHKILIHKEDIEKGDRWFTRHGAKAVFWGRMLPLVRTFVSLPAGVNRMNFKKFSLYTLLGALPWNFALIYAGMQAGEHWDSLRKYFHIFDYAIIVLVAGLIIRHFLKRNHAHV